jgi:hypothetical protein
LRPYFERLNRLEVGLVSNVECLHNFAAALDRDTVAAQREGRVDDVEKFTRVSAMMRAINDESHATALLTEVGRLARAEGFP